MSNNNKAVAKVLESTRQKLLETGTRNRLIHVNRANQRSNSLNIINEQADAVYTILREQSRRMRFKAMGQDKTADDDDVHLAIAQPDPDTDQDRVTDNVIETPVGPDALARRLLRLATDARIAEEEQGLNLLYLAVGFLRWLESPGAEITREAPLLLLPVQLVRNERTSTFDILCREDDVTTNLPLQARLRQDFGILLPEVEESDGWLPSHYFAQVADAVSGQPQWSIDADGMQLGFFSFAKLLMHRDLDPDSWPGNRLAENPVLAGLLIDGFEAAPPLFGATDKLDDILDPAQIIQVVDADASQTRVIEEVRKGANLVVQGPPGTGKSQTITNIIAAAAHDGKTVLFVAEKMAALSVVHNRLVKCGLRDICLELHSRSANKKALSQELGRTLMASAKQLPDTGDPARLRKSRDQLNHLTALLHEPLEVQGDSPFRILSELIGFIGNGTPAPTLPAEGLEKLNSHARSLAISAIKRFVAALDVVGNAQAHAFRGTAAIDLQPVDLERLQGELQTAADAVNRLATAAAVIAGNLGLSTPSAINQVSALITGLQLLAQPPGDLRRCAPVLLPYVDDARLSEALAAGAAWSAAQAAASARFTVSAWSFDPVQIRPAIVAGQTSWLTRLFGGYRNAGKQLATVLSGPLPAKPAERLALVDELATVRIKRKKLADDEPWLQSVLATEWRGEQTPFADLLSTAKWLREFKQACPIESPDQLLSALQSFPAHAGAAEQLAAQVAACRPQILAPLHRLRLDLPQAGLGNDANDVDFTALHAAFTRMLAHSSGYSEWAEFMRSMTAASAQQASAVVNAVLQGSLDSTRAADEFSYACAEARWNLARQLRTDLNALAGMNRHDLVKLFCALEKERIEAARTLILSRHFEQIPRGSAGEMGIIRGEIARKRGHKPLRWVMKNAGTMVQRIKPVMLMSPISVAQFLPPDTVTFDLLVIDEASQIKPEDALGVVARANQIVVVGDQKQLPPTSFFDRLADDVDDESDEEMPVGATAADMESILALCEARGLRQRMLEWHYRSRDPSLIRVSNAEFYQNSLVLPPSPLQLDDDYGMKFHRVPGIYARGGNSGRGRQGTNRIEAEAVVQAVANHARLWPDLSLGVVAFSKAQADMLSDVLELERRRDPVLDAFLQEGKPEDVFVKNIENVQGDERDVILISVGYGPQEANARLPAMSFGPVNGEGGERRLNVLFSRARMRCEIFASFDPGDINPEKAAREGPRVLKRFLEYARTGIMEEAPAPSTASGHPFEEDVARVIRSLGYLADLQVGSAGFRIDIGVRHPDRPGQYLVAVECDGEGYANAPWARERDRLRQSVLENLGWKFHRIWSTDWFYHRKREIEKLKSALESTRTLLEHGIKVAGANQGRPSAGLKDNKADEPPVVELQHLVLTAQPYSRAELTVKSGVEPHEAPVSTLMNLVSKIVEAEGPIHVDEIPRRIASAFGRAKAGKRIVSAADRAIRAALIHNASIRMVGAFLATQQQMENPPVRDRSHESGSVLKPEYLPPLEITAAARQIREESGDVNPEEMVKAVARLLGFKRVSPDLSARINDVLIK